MLTFHPECLHPQQDATCNRLFVKKTILKPLDLILFLHFELFLCCNRMWRNDIKIWCRVSVWIPVNYWRVFWWLQCFMYFTCRSDQQRPPSAEQHHSIRNLFPHFSASFQQLEMKLRWISPLVTFNKQIYVYWMKFVSAFLCREGKSLLWFPCFLVSGSDLGK